MFEWLSYSIILLATAFFVLYKYFTRDFDYWKKRNVPYDTPIPFFGSMRNMLLMKRTVGHWLEDLYKEAQNRKADVYGIFIMDQPGLMILSPKINRAILQSDFTNFDDRSVVAMLNDPVSNNFIFFTKNPTWKQVRSKVSPVFTSGKLKLMFPLMSNIGKDLQGYIKKISNIPNVESKEICGKYSTNLISRCAFAIDAQSFQNEDAEFRKIARGVFSFTFDTALRQLGSWFLPNFVSIVKMQFFHPKFLKLLKHIFKDVIKSRKEASNLRGNDLVDILLEANRKNGDEYFSDDAILGHAIQFFIAGFETVSSTLSFALYELAVHPEVQQRLREDILEGIQKEGITYPMVTEMKYLDMVVSETLRKYPAVPFLDRRAKEDYKIEGSDIVIPKGTNIYFSLFGFHYDPKYFPDPHKFDPERFVDKSKINVNELYYMPFGAGPRICIGERFGLLGVKIGLVSILSQFKVEACDQTPLPIEFEAKSIILQSKVGVPVKFVPI